MAKDKDPWFLRPGGFRLPRNVTFGVFPDSGMVTQKDTIYSWKATLGILSLPLQDGRFPSDASSNHGSSNLWPWQRGTCQTGPAYPSTSFLCFLCYYFFQYHVDFFFNITLKWALFVTNISGTRIRDNVGIVLRHWTLAPKVQALTNWRYSSNYIETLWSKQNDRRLASNIFKCIFLKTHTIPGMDKSVI